MVFNGIDRSAKIREILIHRSASGYAHNTRNHIPESIDLPLQKLDNAEEIIENEDTPIYVYCRSGSRSRQAAAILGATRHSNVTNIGGITAWTGKVER